MAKMAAEALPPGYLPRAWPANVCSHHFMAWCLDSFMAFENSGCSSIHRYSVSRITPIREAMAVQVLPFLPCSMARSQYSGRYLVGRPTLRLGGGFSGA